MSDQPEQREFRMDLHTMGDSPATKTLQQYHYTKRRLQLLVGLVLIQDLNWRQSDEGLEILVPKEDFCRMVWDSPVNSEVDFAIMRNQSLTITRLS